MGLDSRGGLSNVSMKFDMLLFCGFCGDLDMKLFQGGDKLL